MDRLFCDEAQKCQSAPNRPVKGSNFRMSKPQQLHGYPSLASFIVSDDDKSTFIFRRFDRLSTRNLLYLQSELAELEARQNAFDAEDVEGTMTDKQCARNWADFKNQSQENERQGKRMALVKDIREKLEEYSTSSS
jgi:hypothetical protein